MGSGEDWSEWFQFVTASDKPEPFSFIYLGDAQNNILELWSRVIRQAQNDLPRARFIVHAGDLVNTGDLDQEWGEWFEGAEWVNGMVPSVPMPGNHEYALQRPPRALTPYWNAQFALPQDGPEGLKGTVYSLDYQGVRVISLNSNYANGVDLDVQAQWLEGMLKNNPNRWTFVAFHHPVFSSTPGRDNKPVRDKWLPLLEQYGVDMVLQGHDHTYSRGRVSALPARVALHMPIGGTVFVVSVSGPKMYPLSTANWEQNGAIAQRTAQNTQLYQLLHVDGDAGRGVLRYEARTATGDLYDGFELRKLDNGQKLLRELRPDGREGDTLELAPAR